MKKILPVLLIAVFVLGGCGANKVKISEPATGDKTIYVELVSDPNLITIEMKEFLQSHGYKVSMSSDTSSHSLEFKSKNGVTKSYQNVVDVNARYRLKFAYVTHHMSSSKIVKMTASLYDFKTRKTIGTWVWEWSGLVPAPGTESALETMNTEFLSKAFGESNGR